MQERPASKSEKGVLIRLSSQDCQDINPMECILTNGSFEVLEQRMEVALYMQSGDLMGYPVYRDWTVRNKYTPKLGWKYW